MLVVAIVGAGSVGLSRTLRAPTSACQCRRTRRVALRQRRSGLGCRLGISSLQITLYLDGLVAGHDGRDYRRVGFLIHLYATGYMWDEDDYGRFLRVHESVRVRHAHAGAGRRSC